MASSFPLGVNDELKLSLRQSAYSVQLELTGYNTVCDQFIEKTGSKVILGFYHSKDHAVFLERVYVLFEQHPIGITVSIPGFIRSCAYWDVKVECQFIYDINRELDRLFLCKSYGVHGGHVNSYQVQSDTTRNIRVGPGFISWPEEQYREILLMLEDSPDMRISVNREENELEVSFDDVVIRALPVITPLFGTREDDLAEWLRSA